MQLCVMKNDQRRQCSIDLTFDAINTAIVESEKRSRYRESAVSQRFLNTQILIASVLFSFLIHFKRLISTRINKTTANHKSHNDNNKRKVKEN